ncbi:MAG: branched-chain amino acid ABC transporter substrate-binding protein, partial [Actinobacteria bacterium]|nr:branched-chain amino acid ABC transporter substrate-binding protein [Actinomycetota bacterium]
MGRSTRVRWEALALVVALTLVAGACGKEKKKGATGGPSGQKTVTIGFVGALTGDNANLGVNIRDAMRVAVDEENAKGGTQVAVKPFDTAGDAAQATTIKDQFIGDKSVVAIVGPAFSGETKAVLPSLQDAGLVMISASATNKDLPGLVPPAGVFHRVIADDALQAAGISDFLAKVEKPRSVAFIHDNTEYGKGLALDVVKLSVAKGVTQAKLGSGGIGTVDPKAQDFSATVNAVKSAKPDAVFYGGYYAEAGRLRKQLVDAGVNVKFISGDGSLDPGFVTAAGPQAAEGALLTCPCNLALPGSTGSLKSFYDSFKAKIGKDPGLYSPEAYDASKILIQGIKAGNQDRAGLLSYVESFGRYEGVSKTIEFEPNGNLRSKTFFVFQVKDGRIVPLQQLEVAGATGATTPGGSTTTGSR